MLGHTDASKAQCTQCIDCGKLLSLSSNKPGKQTIHGLKCHLEKCHKDIYTLYARKVESRQQGPPAKKAKLDEVLAAHCRADLVTECMKRKKKLILSGDFHFRFSTENECPFSFLFHFRPQMEFNFRRHFRLWHEMRNAFRSASSIHHKKGLGLVMRCKVLVLILNTRLGLGLEIKVSVLILVLKKRLDYITGW